MIKILIADDQELIRESLKIILDMNNDIKVVGVADNGRKVLDLIKKTLPDIILMDIRMPELDGVHCTKAVKEKFPDVKIIILTTFDDDEYVFYALKFGARINFGDSYRHERRLHSQSKRPYQSRQALQSNGANEHRAGTGRQES